MRQFLLQHVFFRLQGAPPGEYVTLDPALAFIRLLEALERSCEELITRRVQAILISAQYNAPSRWIAIITLQPDLDTSTTPIVIRAIPSILTVDQDLQPTLTVVNPPPLTDSNTEVLPTCENSDSPMPSTSRQAYGHPTDTA